MSGVTREKAQAAKEEAMEVFSRLADVVGIGITRVGLDYAIKVNLGAPAASHVRLPSQIQGVPVKVEVVGGIRPR